MKYQYYSNLQLDLLERYGQLMSQMLGDFGNTRNESKWRIPTHCVVLATVYQAEISVNQGMVPVQMGGPIWLASPESIRTSDDPYMGGYYEIYNSSERLVLQVPTIRAAPSLYWALAIQPLLTILALAATALLFHVPIARTFGIVSVLAGVDRKSLEML